MSSHKTYTLALERVDAAVTLHLGGRVDSTNAWDFDREVQQSLMATDTVLLIDCANLRYISSAGLRVALKLAKNFRSPKKFAMSSLSSSIAEIVQISGFDQIIAVYATAEEAMAAL